jgi:hypothetical protein
MEENMTQTTDPVTAVVNRLPGVIQEDVYKLLALHANAGAKAWEVFDDDEAVVAAVAVVNAYDAALRLISEEFGEPDLAPPNSDEDDEPECFDGPLNIDAGSLAPAFPPFLQAQLDRRADTMREKYAH